MIAAVIDPELNSSKRMIALTDFAWSMGYTTDWRENWSFKRWDGSFVNTGRSGL